MAKFGLNHLVTLRNSRRSPLIESLDRFLLVAATISFPATMDIVAVDGSDACDVDGRASRLKQCITLNTCDDTLGGQTQMKQKNNRNAFQN